MFKRKKTRETILCPNRCGAIFSLNQRNEPKGMAQHLENCGGTFTFPQNCKDVLLKVKKQIENNKL